MNDMSWNASKCLDQVAASFEARRFAAGTSG